MVTPLESAWATTSERYIFTKLPDTKYLLRLTAVRWPPLSPCKATSVKLH